MTKRQRTVQIERDAINYLCNKYGCIPHGLRKTILNAHKYKYRESINDEDIIESLHYIKCDIKAIANVIPDASKFSVKKISGTQEKIICIECFEVVNTHSISEEKMNKYEFLALELFDCYEFAVRVYETNRYGKKRFLVFDSMQTMFNKPFFLV